MNEYDDLTPSEHAVVRLIAHGYTNKAIAETLHISHHTVRSHVLNSLRKWHVTTRTELTVLAIARDLVSLAAAKDAIERRQALRV
jgi:two-component system nitrate/nitrite response regulator NarL